MPTQVAFLRAANLGKRRVDAKRLAAVTQEAGHDDAWTFINSGNVVFTAGGAKATLESSLEKRYEEAFGFELTTFVRTSAQLAKTLDATPFDVGADDTHFVTFLKKAPAAQAKKQLEALSGDFDTLVVVGADVHWRMHGKSSDSPLVKRDWERILGVNTSTSRNTTMLRKLLAKIEAKG